MYAYVHICILSSSCIVLCGGQPEDRREPKRRKFDERTDQILDDILGKLDYRLGGFCRLITSDNIKLVWGLCPSKPHVVPLKDSSLTTHGPSRVYPIVPEDHSRYSKSQRKNII